MEIKLGTTNSDIRSLNKSVSWTNTYQCVLKENTSVSSPKIRLNERVNTNLNYAYIPEFGRYYYVTDFEVEHNNVLSVSLRVDVLMSFAGDIRSSYGIRTRVSDASASYAALPVGDPYIEPELNETTETVSFERSFDTEGVVVLTTA